MMQKNEETKGEGQKRFRDGTPKNCDLSHWSEAQLRYGADRLFEALGRDTWERIEAGVADETDESFLKRIDEYGEYLAIPRHEVEATIGAFAYQRKKLASADLLEAKMRELRSKGLSYREIAKHLKTTKHQVEKLIGNGKANKAAKKPSTPKIG